MSLRTKSTLLIGQILAIAVAACGMECGNTNGSAKSHKANVSPKSCIRGDQAMTHIYNIIGFGPRHVGTHGLEQTRRYIIDQLKQMGHSPFRQEFTAYTPDPEMRQVKMANIIVNIDGPGPKKILIGSHFDGKRIPGIQFQGANDGGSSTALLLEIARCLALSPPPVPIQLVFFDGEEAVINWSDSDSLYGSKHFATEIKAADSVDQYIAAVIIDMIGDKRLKLMDDIYSTPWVSQRIREVGRRMGHHEILNGIRTGVDDDHQPLLDIGIPSALLIDLRYGPGWQNNAYWHTDQDTPDKLSPTNIEKVGQIVMASLPELARGQK